MIDNWWKISKGDASCGRMEIAIKSDSHTSITTTNPSNAFPDTENIGRLCGTVLSARCLNSKIYTRGWNLRPEGNQGKEPCQTFILLIYFMLQTEKQHKFSCLNCSLRILCNKSRLSIWNTTLMESWVIMLTTTKQAKKESAKGLWVCKLHVCSESMKRKESVLWKESRRRG